MEKLGEGGEAEVFALDDRRVLRKFRRVDHPSIEERVSLAEEVAAGAGSVGFMVPEILDVFEDEDGYPCFIERRLPGRSMTDALRDVDGRRRELLLASYMTTAQEIRAIELDRPWFGELLRPEQLRTRSWSGFLGSALRRQSSAADPDQYPEVADFEGEVSLLRETLRSVPEPVPSLVHFDYFPGNVLCDDTRVLAVIDWSALSIVGDPDLDVSLAAGYLGVTPTATEAPDPRTTGVDAAVATVRRVIWEHEVEAFNTATQSTNRMHDDRVARTFGFRGGLVPGVDVWAYLTGPCVDRWGSAFLERGVLDVRFVAPVYDGERVRVRLDELGSVEALGPTGDVRASGQATLADPPPVRSIGRAERPAELPAAAAQLLQPGTVLGTLELVYEAERGAQYLEDVRDERAVYGGGAICHPGLLARQANYVLSRSVQLGPWIHVSTRAHHRGVVRDGEQLEVRGVVSDEREHKGHRFVDLWVEIAATGRPVWSAFHTAIWQPRRNR